MAGKRRVNPPYGVAGKFQGIYFNDSDVFKVIEGASYSLSLYPDPNLEAYVDEVIAKIAAAQEPPPTQSPPTQRLVRRAGDGYLYTSRTLCGPDYMPPGGKERWSVPDLRFEIWDFQSSIYNPKSTIPWGGRSRALQCWTPIRGICCSLQGNRQTLTARCSH